MSGPFVQLKVWFPQKNSRNQKYNYGHISMLIPNRFIPEHLKSFFEDKDCYISYVKAQGSQRGFSIVDNYDDDQNKIMNRHADDFARITGLDISAILEKHMEYISKFRDGIGTYHFVSFDSVFSRTAHDFGGVPELESKFHGDVTTEWLGEANCTEYVWMLLQAGGMKKNQQFSKEAMNHFGLAGLLGMFWMAMGIRYKDFTVTTAGLLTFMYVVFVGFLTGLVAMCNRSLRGQASALTPTGLFDMAKQFNSSQKGLYNLPFTFFKCIGASGLAFSGFWLMFNVFCVASLKKMDNLQYTSAMIGGICLLTAITLQCKKVFLQNDDTSTTNFLVSDHNPMKAKI